jgi:hypothetical protein
MSDANILADGAAAENILNNSEDSLYKDQTTEKEKQIVEEREAILACQAIKKPIGLLSKGIRRAPTMRR